jgi:hypothetical protein
MSDAIYCPRCGAENSAFALFMSLTRCRQCGYDLEVIQVREALRRGSTLRGQSSLYEYEVSKKGAEFFPRGLLLAPPLALDGGRNCLRVSGDPTATQGFSMLWWRLKGSYLELSFDQVVRIEVVYQVEKVAREDHPYQHHWDVALVLRDGQQVPLGRITAERQFPGPVLSHHYALRLAHALHELAGWPVQQREKVEKPPEMA